MPRCASCGCWYGPSSKERGVSFHKFPRDHDRLHRWLVSMRNNLVNKLTPEKIKELVHKKGFHWRVCSDHFQPGCFTRKSFLKRQLCPDHTTYLELEKDAVPTLFSGPGENDRKQCRPPSKYQQRKEHSRVRVIKMRKEDNRRRQEPGLKELKNAGRSGSPNNKQPRLQRKGRRKTPLCTPVQVALSEEALPTVFGGEKKTRESPGRKRGQKQAPEVELISSVKKTDKRKRTEDTPDVPDENLSVNLQSQLSRWKGACKALRLTDDQMAKFLLDRYYKGDQSSAYTGSQSTHKTLLLDRGLLTLWNDSMADKGFSSDKDFLWFLLLGPQKSGTDSEGLTVRDHGASDECVPVKVHYVGPGYTASDNIQDLHDAADCPPILQPPTCKPNLTQSKNMIETGMTAPVLVTSPNNELHMLTHKKCRKQVHVPGPKKDDPVFLETLDKEDSHCDFVRVGHIDTDPMQPEKVGGRENGASTPFTATQKPSNTHTPNKAKRRKYLVPGPREEPAKDMNGLSTSENSNTCSQPTSGEVGVDLKEKDELEIDLNDCNSSITSQLCSGAGPIPVKQEDGHNSSLTSQLSWGGTVRTKVEKEDEQGMNLCSFDNTNLTSRAKRRKYLVPGPREGPSKDTSNCESSTTCSKYLVPGPMAKPIKDLGNSENTTTAPQPSCGEVGNDFLEEDELEIDLNDCDITTASSHISSGTVCIKQEDEVEKTLVKSDNHSMSSQQRWGSAVNIKVEKEDGLEMNLCHFSNTNVSCRQYSTNIIKGNNVGFDNCDYTSTPQLCHDTVSIKVEREDGLEMDFGCCSTGNTITPSETEPSFDTDDIQDEELEMHLKRAILATAEHLG